MSFPQLHLDLGRLWDVRSCGNFLKFNLTTIISTILRNNNVFFKGVGSQGACYPCRWWWFPGSRAEYELFRGHRCTEQLESAPSLRSYLGIFGDLALRILQPPSNYPFLSILLCLRMYYINISRPSSLLWCRWRFLCLIYVVLYGRARYPPTNLLYNGSSRKVYSVWANLVRRLNGKLMNK